MSFTGKAVLLLAVAAGAAVAQPQGNGAGQGGVYGVEHQYGDDASREAVKHWTKGVIAFQRGDIGGAQREWTLCRQIDPSNRNCKEDLKKLDKPEAAPVRPNPGSNGRVMRPPITGSNGRVMGDNRPGPPVPASPVLDADKQLAVKHWTAGIAAHQKGDMAKARDEWTACKRLDPTNQDCLAGIMRIDSTYEGTP